MDNIVLAQSIINVQTERMCGNTLSKYKNEDVNDEEYQEIAHAFFFCSHCKYKTTRNELKGHMKQDHTEDEPAPLAEDESTKGSRLLIKPGSGDQRQRNKTVYRTNQVQNR